MLQASSPLNYLRVNSAVPSSFFESAVGGVLGAAFGGLVGSSTGSIKGAIMGGIAGGFIGGVVAPTAQMMGFVGVNRDFYSQSPYANRSTTTAAALNASGNIVLGMHNSRGGY